MREFKFFKKNGVGNSGSIGTSGDIGGSGTINYVPLYTGATVIGNSIIQQNVTATSARERIIGNLINDTHPMWD